MKVLILGGTGYIGLPITRRLLERGHEVAVFHRGTAGTSIPDDVRLIAGERNRLADSAAEFRGLRPDIVVDTITYTLQQAKQMVDTFRGIAGRTVVLSSGDVYRANDVFFRRTGDPIQATPLSETSPLRGRLFPYSGAAMPEQASFSWNDYEKILVERVVLTDSDLSGTVLRLPMVYGPGDRGGKKRRFFAYQKRMDDGRPAILFDIRTANWRAPWGYTEDIAEAVRLAVENRRAAGEIYNVAETAGRGLLDRIRELADAAGWKGRFVVVDKSCPPPNLPRSLNLDQNIEMDSRKIRRDLGYRQTLPRRKALERTIAWNREHPPAEIHEAQFDYAAEDAVLAEAASAR